MPSPGRSGISIMPSFTGKPSSIRSCSIGLAPSEYSTMNPAGEAAATCSPAAKAGAPAHRCGASLRLKALAMAPIRIASVMPPQIARSGCRMSTAREHRQIAEIVAGELALAGGDRDVGRGAHLGLPGLVVGDDRLLEPGEVAVLDEAAEALGLGHREGAVRVAHQLDIRPERRARRVHAARPSGAGRRP